MEEQDGLPEAERIYQKFKKQGLESTSSQESPRAILLGGQPGSGKTFLLSTIGKELADKGGAVVIDPDILREDDPLFIEQSQTDPIHAGDRSHEQASTLAKRLTAAMISERRNLVIDGTMGNPESVRKKIHLLRQHGYAIDVHVMAVNPKLSKVRADLRFEKQVAEKERGRFVPESVHDAAYEGLSRSVDMMEQECLVDSMHIHDSDRQRIYENRLIDGNWQKGPAAMSTLIAERTREQTPEELQKLLSNQEDLIHLAKRREGVQDNVVYTLGSETNGDGKSYSSVHDVAAAFRDARQEDLPYIKRTERMPSGRMQTSMVGQTTVTRKDGQRHHGKDIVGTDGFLKSAYTDACAHKQPIRLHNLPDLEKRKNQLMDSLQQFEKKERGRAEEAFAGLHRPEVMNRTMKELRAPYAQQKHDQAMRIEKKLESRISQAQKALKQGDEHRPGVFSLPSTRRAWEATQANRKERIHQLKKRQNTVREIRTGMGTSAPRIEELANRKMRAENPKMAARQNAMTRAFRVKQVKAQQQARTERREQRLQQGRTRRMKM
jgi:predicted ABC-type ATPase